MRIERCEWSDLPIEACAHCGAAPGTRVRLADRGAMLRPPTPEPEPTLEQPRLPETWSADAEAGECRCGKPARDDAWLCDGCEQRFTATLADLGALDEELSVTMTKQRAAATSGGAKSSDKGLPWHDKAAEARRALHGLLVSWVRLCEEEDVRGPEIDFPADTIPSLASWLATRVHGLALRDVGPEAMDEITDAAAECHRVIFWKRRSRTYLGTCGHVDTDPDEYGIANLEPCPGEVYAEEGEQVGECDLCGQGVTVVIRKAEIDRRLDDRLCTPAEIATYAVHLGLDVPREKVRQRVNYWHRHKRIEQKGSNDDGAPLFKYGDVRGMLYQEFARHAG